MEHSNRNLWIGLGILAVLLLFALPAWGGGMMVGRGFAGVGPFGVRPFVGPWVWGMWGVVLLLFALPAWGGGMMVGRGFAGVGPFGVRPFVGPWGWGMWGGARLVALVFFGF